jgi:hypothetical protein
MLKSKNKEEDSNNNKINVDVIEYWHKDLQLMVNDDPCGWLND